MTASQWLGGQVHSFTVSVTFAAVCLPQAPPQQTRELANVLMEADWIIRTEFGFSSYS